MKKKKKKIKKIKIKNKNFGGIIILHMCTINYDHMIYGS